ncbi:MAG TPA: YoaK family protein [Solirubrobacteraceae bacterium]|nr:YoaK family protein [Solirubrobacteraceae bacterium]
MDAVSAANVSHFDEQALRRDAASVRHPLTRALVVLTFTTGLVDAVAYLGLGHVFTANMTGNIVLLGFGIAGSGGLPVVAPIVSLVSFLVGAGAGGTLVKHLADRHSALVARALGVEVTLLAAATVLAAVTTVHPGDPAAYALIVLMALAMGVRNAVVRRIGIADMTTTVLTLTLTGLAADSVAAGGTGKGSLRRTTAVVAMLAGAVVGALLLKAALFLPLALAAVSALATWLAYVPGASRRERSAGV